MHAFKEVKCSVRTLVFLNYSFHFWFPVAQLEVLVLNLTSARYFAIYPPDFLIHPLAPYGLPTGSHASLHYLPPVRCPGQHTNTCYPGM